MKPGMQNEWNEQVEFSEFYFKITMACRYYQSQDNLAEWYRTLQSKISFIIGVLDEKVVKEIKEARQTLQTVFSDYISCRKRSASLRGLTPEYKQASYLLAETLFEFESEIDEEVNKVMPFLNLHKLDSVEDFE